MFKNRDKLLKEQNDKLLVQMVFQNPCLYIKHVQQLSQSGSVERTWAFIAKLLKDSGIPIPGSLLYLCIFN